MKIADGLNDDATLREIGRRARRARLDRRLTQADLARIAGVARPTVERFESAGVAHLTTLVRILRAMDLLDRLDSLLPEVDIRPIEALQTRGEGRKRASRPRKPKPGVAWTWGDEQ
jgi:putative transcriptional regulator